MWYNSRVIWYKGCKICHGLNIILHRDFLQFEFDNLWISLVSVWQCAYITDLTVRGSRLRMWLCMIGMFDTKQIIRHHFVNVICHTLRFGVRHPWPTLKYTIIRIHYQGSINCKWKIRSFYVFWVPIRGTGIRFFVFSMTQGKVYCFFIAEIPWISKCDVLTLKMFIR